MSKRIFLSFAATLFFSALLLLPVHASAGALTVAVSSNALRPVQEIAGAFEESTGEKVRIVHGSTGKLFAQITQGAPFDIFLSADRLRPKLLIEKGLAGAGSSFTYVKGALVLWTRRDDLGLKENGLEVLFDESVKKIAIANPITAPYGRAAMDVLIGGYMPKSGKRVDIKGKIVYGESVSQAFSYARTGNADLTITALSTIYGQSGGQSIVVDESFYERIEQDGVILKGARKEAQAFKDFLFGKAATEIFTRYGYITDGNIDE